MIGNEDGLIGATLHEVAQLVRMRIDDEAKSSGLTRLSWLAASYIADTPGLTLSQLAEKLEIGNAPTGKLIDRMEAAALIERRASATDRRSQTVFLTEKGVKALEELRSKNQYLREVILADLTSDERKTLEDLLLRIKSQLKRLNS